jgi:hypothetical protein
VDAHFPRSKHAVHTEGKCLLRQRKAARQCLVWSKFNSLYWFSIILVDMDLSPP